MKNRIFSAILCVIMILCTACASSGASADMNYFSAGGDSYDYKVESESLYNSSVSMDTGMAISPAAPMESGKPAETAGSSTANSDALADRKIVRTMYIDAESKAFDDATATIEALCAELGGYIENSSRSGGSLYNSSIVARSANYTLRIPAERLEDFRAGMTGSINIVSESSEIEDITDQYFDVDTRLATLRIEEERLLAMLEKATELEYLITLERRLTEVRYEIESYTGTLRRYDNRVAYSTVRLNLDEVVEYTERIETPKTFGEQLSAAFRESWSDFASGCRSFAIWFVYAIPTLVVIAVVAVSAAVILTLIFRRPKKAKKAKPDDTTPNA